MIKAVYGIGKIAVWGALLYGTIVPAYRLVESINSLTQLAYSARENIEMRTDKSRAEQFEGIFRYAQGKEKEGEQKAVRQLRRNIENVLKVDCNTIDSAQYEMPAVELRKKGLYELRMECRMKELVISFPREKVKLSEREYR